MNAIAFRSIFSQIPPTVRLKASYVGQNFRPIKQKPTPQGKRRKCSNFIIS